MSFIDLVEVLTYLPARLLRCLQGLNQLGIIKNDIDVLAEAIQYLFLKLLKDLDALEGFLAHFDALLLELALLTGNHDAQHLLLETLDGHMEVDLSGKDADVWAEARALEL